MAGMIIRSLADFGGALSNYAPVTDPTTDEDAKYRNRYATDAASMTHTAPRAICSFVTVSAGAPTDPTGFVHDSMWGSTNTVKPTAARTALGVWTLRWPTTVDDDLTGEAASIGGGVSYTVSFRRAFAQAEPASTALQHVVAKVTSSNVITVYGFDATGAASDIAGAVVTVWAF